MRLDGGESVLLHLGMSGRMVLAPARPNMPTLHEHLVLETDDGWRVGFVDPRRFGSVDLVPTEQEDAHRLLAGLGPEPLDDAFSPHACPRRWPASGRRSRRRCWTRRSSPASATSMSARRCSAPRLSPRRLADTVPGTRAARLVPAIKETLSEAIAAGGSSLRDYVQPDGELGYFQHAWKVYGREGEPCPRCPGTPACPGIRRIVQSARSTFYCPRTQR